MGETSWQVKAKYNKKVYKSVSVQLKKELVAEWEEKLAKDGISKSEFIRNAITNYPVSYTHLTLPTILRV